MNIFELIRQIENIFTGLVHRFDFPMKGDASSQCEIKTNDIYFTYFFKLNKKKKKEKKKEEKREEKKKLSPPKAEDSEGEACEIWKRCEIGENLRCLQKIKFGG